MKKLYIVPMNFTGHIISSITVNDNGDKYVDYSGALYNNGGDNLTLTEYLEARNLRGETGSFSIINDDQLDELMKADYESKKTKPEEITRERYWEMLEVLPPCRWHKIGSVEVFHVSERLTGNLVSWFAQIGETFYEFTQDASISDSDLIKLLD